VDHVFRLLRNKSTQPRWLLLENVPFMLQLDQGRAMEYLATRLEELGLFWAYRVVDARSFGLPQRRLRVILVASATEDPRTVLFSDESSPIEFADADGYACGFYWTEGNRGLGWAVNAVPTLKGGSTIGIPSPPAIRLRDSRIVTPDLRDAERLQGFAPDWTAPALDGETRIGRRWKLVGNAVSVSVARWVGDRLATPGGFDAARNEPMPLSGSWPFAAWGRRGERRAVRITTWPRSERHADLEKYLAFDPKPLSVKATAGFLSRARASSLRFADGFLDDVARHLDRMNAQATRASSRRTKVGA
jgi:DNA (cytosine-5)-methyltransferase 1